MSILALRFIEKECCRKNATSMSENGYETLILIWWVILGQKNEKTVFDLGSCSNKSVVSSCIFNLKERNNFRKLAICD